MSIGSYNLLRYHSCETYYLYKDQKKKNYCFLSLWMCTQNFLHERILRVVLKNILHIPTYSYNNLLIITFFVFTTTCYQTL